MILLVRHGETEWNRDRRYQGLLDSPLTERGRMQARRLGALLSTTLGGPGGVRTAGIRLVSSPLGRARTTAALVGAALGVPVEIDERVTEIGLGDWEGLTREEVELAYPGVLDGATRYDWYFRAPGGESLDAALARASAWLAEPVATPRVVVSHGVFGRLLRGLHGGLGRDAMIALPTPQDGVHRLDGGTVAFIPAPSVQ